MTKRFYFDYSPCIRSRIDDNCTFIMEPKISISPHRKLEFKGERGFKDVSPALRATDYKCPHVVKEQYRIRKLTPRECFRLMDVSEQDIDKIQNSGVSNSQQYKMAGNSIVVNCLYVIFRNMFSDVILRRDHEYEEALLREHQQTKEIEDLL